MLVKLCVTGIDRGGHYRHIHRSGLRGAVENDLAIGFVEMADLVRQAEMAVLEARESMVVVDDEVSILDLLCDVLEDGGATVLRTTNGRRWLSLRKHSLT